jgi:hypothetical protein
MAKIPTYQTGQTQIANLPNVKQSSIASPELFVGISGARGMADLGEGLSKAGVAGMKYAGELQEKEDIAIVKQVESSFLTDITGYELQGKQKLGLNAATLPTQSDEFYEQTVQKYGENLNDRQKAIFSNIAARHAPSFKNSMYAHSADQINKAQESSFKASLESYQSRAAANPAAAADMKAELDRTLNAWGQIKGLDAATLDRAKLEEKTKLHTAVLGALEQAGDMDAVKGYFYSNIKEIDGTKHAEIKKAIETSDRSRKVQSFADDVVSNQKLPMDQALKLARENFDGEDEKHAVVELKQRYSEIEAIAKDSEQKAFNQAYDLAIDKKGGRRAIPASLWNQLDPQSKESINSKLTGGAAKTNQGVWYTLYQESIMDPQAFIKRDLRKDAPNLSSSDFQELAKLQASVKKDIDKPDKMKRVFTVGQQINQTIDSIGIPATSNNKDTRDKRALATRAVSDAVTRKAASLGKEVDQLTEEEVQQAADKVLIKGTVVRDWKMDKEKYVFELAPDEKAKFQIEIADVPADFIAESKAYAAKYRRKISDEDIAIAYRKLIVK